MEKVLQDILNKLNSLEEGQKELRTDFARLEEGQKELRADFGRLENGQKELKADFSDLTSAVNRMEKKQDTMESTLNKIAGKQDAIFEQTAGLLEFRTETSSTLKEIKEDQTTLMEMYGDHELQIRNLKKRTV